MLLNSYIIIDSSINHINTKDSTVRWLTFVANLITTKLEYNKEAGLGILLKVTVNKVAQVKYNFDASDPPILHQMAPSSMQISKKFLRGNAPRPP